MDDKSIVNINGTTKQNSTVGGSGTVQCPKLKIKNFNKNVENYADAFKFFGLNPFKLGKNLDRESFWNNAKKEMFKYHPDINQKDKNASDKFDKINQYGTHVKEFLANNEKKLGHYVNNQKIINKNSMPYTRQQMFTKYMENIVGTGAMFFVSDLITDPIFGNSNGDLSKKIDPGLYLKNRMDSGVFAVGYGLINSYGMYNMKLPFSGAGSLAWGSFALAGIHSLPSDNYKGIGVISGLVNFSSFFGTAAVTTPMFSKWISSGRIKPTGAGWMQFFIANMVASAADFGLNKIYQTELGAKIINSDTTKTLGQYVVPAADWLNFTYPTMLKSTMVKGREIVRFSLKNYSSSLMQMKKIPKIGTAIYSAVTLYNNHQLLTSGDLYTTLWGLYKTGKEALIVFTSIEAGIGAGLLAGETGPGAFVVGLGGYEVADRGLRSGFNYMEKETGFRNLMENKLISEPLKKAGINLMIVNEENTRNDQVNKLIDNLPAEDLRGYINGNNNFEIYDSDADGKVRMDPSEMKPFIKRMNFKKELKNLGIKQFNAENLHDLSPEVIYSVILQAQGVRSYIALAENYEENPLNKGPKTLNITLKYKKPKVTEIGTQAVYDLKIEALDASGKILSYKDQGQTMLPYETEVLSTLEAAQSKNNVSLEELYSKELSTENADKKDMERKLKLAKELQYLNVKEIKIEDPKELTPEVLDGIKTLAKKVVMPPNATMTFTTAYTQTKYDENGLRAIYNVKIDVVDASGKVTTINGNKKDQVSRFLSRTSLSSNENATFPIDLLNREKDYGVHRTGINYNADMFFSRPHVATMQIAQCLETLGFFGINEERKHVQVGNEKYTMKACDRTRESILTAGAGDLFVTLESNSYENLKTYLKNESNANITSKLITERLLMFQGVLLRAGLISENETGYFGDYTLLLLKILAEVKTTGKPLAEVLTKYYSELQNETKIPIETIQAMYDRSAETGSSLPLDDDMKKKVAKQLYIAFLYQNQEYKAALNNVIPELHKMEAKSTREITVKIQNMADNILLAKKDPRARFINNISNKQNSNDIENNNKQIEITAFLESPYEFCLQNMSIDNTKNQPVKK